MRPRRRPLGERGEAGRLCPRPPSGGLLRAVVPALAAAVIGLGLSAGGAFFAYSRDQEVARVEFEQLAENRALLTQQELHDIEQSMSAIRGLFEFAKTGVGRAAFAALADSLAPASPGVVRISWIPRIADDRRAAFETEMAREGLADYRISEFDAAVPAADREEYFPVSYQEFFPGAGAPADGASAGADLGSAAALPPLLDRARDSGQISASAMRDAPGRPAALSLFAPAYEDGLAGATPQERRRRLAGFVEFLVDAGAAIEQIQRGIVSPRGLDLYFFEEMAGPDSLPFYVRSSPLRRSPAPLLRRGALERQAHSTRELRLGDARWAMIVVPLPLPAPFGRAWIVLAAGIAVTGSACAYILAATRDAAARETALAELRRRDRILDAVMACASVLAGEPAPDRAIPEALRIAGEAVAIDRALVLEAAAAPDGRAGLALRYQWQAPDVPVRLTQAFFADLPPAAPELGALLAPLRAGKAVTARLATAQGAVLALLRKTGVRSLLIVPILVGGRFWGQVGFDDCRTERQWNAAETDALKTLAEMLGSAIVRARAAQSLADADRIVERSPTILYRLRGEPSLPMTYISPNVSRILGYPADRFLRSSGFYRTLCHPDDRAAVEAAEQDLIERGRDACVREYRVRAADGTYRWLENRAAARRGPDGRLEEIEGLLIDMTERKASEQRIAELARSDPLTGLANRRSFLDRLGLAFAEARRGGAPFAVLSLDLDHFKDVNDTLGHPCGDRVLQAVAGRLAASLREVDLVARFGGDEFTVLEADVTDPSGAGALAQKLRAHVASPCEVDGNEVHISASVGVALYSAELEAAEDLLAQADRALYRAKQEGRDRYRFHSEELDAVVHAEVALAAELRAALGDDQLEIYYQPQVAVRSGAVVGIEALLRWNHPRLGLLLPAAFLPVAERTGAIVALGHWVLDRACRQLRLWRDAGLKPPVLAVNLSAAQLRLGQEFERDVLATLDKWGLAPADIEFDVGEAVLLDTTRGHAEVLERLQRLGIAVAIDDFGSDYTAIGRLRACRVKRFKIAPQWVAAMTHSAEAAAIVRAMIGLARQLGLGIVAEGVETERQRAFLIAASKGAATAQGFYFSRPVPAQQAGELLRRGRIAPAARGRAPMPVAAADARAQRR